MGLNHPKSGGGASARFAPPSLLSAYLAAVCTLGLGGILAVVALTPWVELSDHVMTLQVAFLAIAAIAGEVRPIRLVIGGDETRRLSTSAPFVLALIGVAGVGVAVVVQLIASLADDALRRREPKKSLFNTAQYALSVIVAGLVYAWLTGGDVFASTPSDPVTYLAALLVAGVAMIATNWVLVAVVVSLATGQPLRDAVREDIRDLLITNIVLLSIGGVAAEVAADGIGALLLLVAPVVAAHLFTMAAARHAHDATHDSLTGLGNRGQLHHELDNAFAAPAPLRLGGPGLVLIDLDHFKDFNDTLGHPVGDEILRQVAVRLREVAPEGASVHRLGGDEFAVVVRGDLAASRQVARDILASLDEPVRVESLELLVRASAGLAVAPLHGEDGETLMKNADIALYHAKLERDRISTFSPEFDINTVERLQLLADLRTALDTGQLHVVYQPQTDLTDGRVVAVEALVRWRHPERGLVRADEFIPLAENSGLIFPVTAFVLDTALAQVARWHAAGLDVRMAVNLSARHLSDQGLPQQVGAALTRHQVPASSLVLEVTETAILSDPARADLVLHALRRLGVSIAIDDYGTGNASLSYLKRLEIDELKIDRSFVSNIGADHHDLIIVRSTISLALALDLRVVAEGIEDAETVTALRGLGHVIGQGYHLGRPVEAPELERRLGIAPVSDTDAAPARIV
ncbi:EAL domain-containing protein [Demequina sp. SYSU T00192]|uniref:EAL domain-containing protein n=1 Tax=Demequina litoralis TaxID=3051660 RepID=A0ABT8G802_9MICO|nr:EAL domain-containing protein [Demequina sp. SYSU T00192]MDN4475182.1 EAL domain-containing protein [Demequina sp. SYSU T00192]